MKGSAKRFVSRYPDVIFPGVANSVPQEEGPQEVSEEEPFESVAWDSKTPEHKADMYYILSALTDTDGTVQCGG